MYLRIQIFIDFCLLSVHVDGQPLLHSGRCNTFWHQTHQGDVRIAIFTSAHFVKMYHWMEMEFVTLRSKDKLLMEGAKSASSVDNLLL